MAMQQVIDTCELLESILSHLPTRDLLMVMRVSTSWKLLLDTSPTLQRALFFTAPPGSVMRLDEMMFDPELSAVRPAAPIHAPGPFTIMPFFKEEQGFNTLHAWSFTAPALELRSLNLISYFFVWPLSLVEADANGSWRSMLFTQPPVRAVLLFLAVYKCPETITTVRADEGIRLGHIADVFGKIVKQLGGTFNGPEAFKDKELRFKSEVAKTETW